MKISTNTLDAPSPAAVPCAHCGAPVTGACSLVVHVLDNPEHGRPQVNAFTAFQFCSPSCRSAWWETPASERCFPDPSPVTSQLGHPLSALIVHGDRGELLPISIETDDGGLLAEHMGAIVSHHSFEDPEHIERWWRGEIEVESLVIPIKEASGA